VSYRAFRGRPGGLADWNGTFSYDDPTAWIEPGAATLRLPGEITAEVVITSVQIGAAGVGSFVGNGAPPAMTPI
jgi:hypothetical protein